MKRHFTFFAAILFSAILMADKYTIVFNSSTSDSSTPTTELSSIVLRATDNCVASIKTANCIYRAKEGFGIKGAKSDAKGELTIGLDAIYNISTLTVYAAPFVSKNGTPDNKKIFVCGQEVNWNSDHFTEIYPYTITFNRSSDSITITSSVKNSNRWYVQKIEFEAEDPHPT